MSTAVIELEHLPVEIHFSVALDALDTPDTLCDECGTLAVPI
jgi:hypothetical protein